MESKGGTVMKLLELKEVTTLFHTRKEDIVAIDEVSFFINEHEIVGLIGESGSGKTQTAYSILQLLEDNEEITHGELIFEGQNLLAIQKDAIMKIRKNDISMIFQDSRASLDPLFTIEQSMKELQLHDSLDLTSLLEGVGAMPVKRILASYPHQLSTGMCQRVCIAMALMKEVKLLICDEPCASLDSIHTQQVMQLFKEKQKEKDCAMLFITHQIPYLYDLASRIIIMYCHEVVEIISHDDLFVKRQILHPYTKGLLDSIPQNNQELKMMNGNIMDSEKVSCGCRFAPRCDLAQPRCHIEKPHLTNISDSHLIACFYPYSIK